MKLLLLLAVIGYMSVGGMNLNGKWVNQLQSNVTLIAEEDGQLKGHYETAVSSTGSSLPPTPIMGTWQKTDEGVLFGFTAQWKFKQDGETKYSTTSWSGVGRDSFPDSLVTTWVLTSFLEPSQSWKSVTINKDTFRRI